MQRATGNPHGLGIDHLLFVSRDLQRGADAMTRLGFTVAPQSPHSAHLGTENRTVMFQDDYLEIIAVATPTPHNQLHRDCLEMGEGWHIAAITTDSIPRTKAALLKAGIETADPVSFSRPIDVPGRGQVTAAFEVVRPLREALPNGFMFFCNHKTPENVWVEEWTKHQNTTRRMAGLVIATETPEKTVDIYGSLFSSGDRSNVTGGISLPSGKARLDFLKSERINSLYGSVGIDQVGSPFYKVVQFEVESLDAATAAMSSNAVPFHRSRTGSVLIEPTFGCGTVLEFVTTDVVALTQS